MLLSWVLDLSYTGVLMPCGSPALFVLSPRIHDRLLIIGLEYAHHPLLSAFGGFDAGELRFTSKPPSPSSSPCSLGRIVERIIRWLRHRFIDIHYWPIFNAADIYITVGAILLILVTWTRGRRESLPAQYLFVC